MAGRITSADGIQIAIGVATRNRPRTLASLLDSFHAMRVPNNVKIHYFIVENNTTLTMIPVVDHFTRYLEPRHSAILLHEPRIGIPFARNKALDASTRRGCRWLVFVDDDETVDPDWLSNLLKGAEAQGFDLAGGPVVPLRPADTLSDRQIAIFDQYVSDARRRLHVRESRMAAGEGNRNDLATNNWIARVAALEKAGLRFDESMAHTGGTDTNLSRQAKQAGLKLGWVSEAVVYEVVPPDRLKLRYVFRRSRSQTLAKYHMRYRKHGRWGIMPCVSAATTKGLVGAIRVVLGLVAGTRMKVRGVRTLGIAMGYLQGVLGCSSNFYVETDGH